MAGLFAGGMPTLKKAGGVKTGECAVGAEGRRGGRGSKDGLLEPWREWGGVGWVQLRSAARASHENRL